MAAPYCPTCGTVATWHPQTSQFGCDRCQRMLHQAPQAPAQFQPLTTPVNQLGGNIAPPPPLPAPPPTPGCQRCGLSATFYPQSNSWGCQRCQMPVIPIKFIGPPTTSAARILLITFIVIVVIALNVAIGAMR